MEQTTIDTWESRARLDERPSKMPTVIYTANAALPVAFDTLLVPFEGANPPALTVAPIEKSADGLDSAFAVTQGKVADLYVFQRAAKAKRMAAQRVAFDGERLFVRRVNGKLRSLVLVNGTNVRVDGKDIVQLAKPVKWLVVEFTKSGRRQYSSEP